MQIRLVVQSGSHQGRVIEVVGERFMIGRSESCQLRPKSESVSRKHCILAIHDGRVLLQDLKSRNGTFINDKRLPPDKAKVLKSGDMLRVGKLKFELLIEHGLQAAKKPVVKDLADAAERTAESSGGESRFEEVDVNSWLDEADAIDRVRKQADPDTRQLTLSDLQRGEDSEESTDLSVEGSNQSDGDSKAGTQQVVEEGSSRVIPPKGGKPGKLPDHVKAMMKDSSRDAADDALKKFFSGR
ncbi:MAG: FHA domain-containing protein [Planctomycetota bacterium]